MCYGMKMSISLRFSHGFPKTLSKVLKLEQLVQKCKLCDNIQDQDDATEQEWTAFAVIKATWSTWMTGKSLCCA